MSSYSYSYILHHGLELVPFTLYLSLKALFISHTSYLIKPEFRTVVCSLLCICCKNAFCNLSVESLTTSFDVFPQVNQKLIFWYFVPFELISRLRQASELFFFLDLMFEEEYFKPQDDKVTRWKNYKMKRWQVEMWQDDKMTGWQDEKKTRWQYDKKTRWQDGKMGVEKGEFVYKDLLIWNPRQILRVPQSM